ncbi:porin, partial [Alphaproteobacteria bacterium]|nr:porin [Alphaproteobacteria bacterium]
NEESMSVVGGTLAFAMSTETSNGVSVSSSITVSADTDNVVASAVNAGPAFGGMESIVFGMDGMTVTLGDINNAGSGTGAGGDVTSFAATHASSITSNTGNTASGDAAIDGIADGQGINVATSMGDIAVNGTYVTTVGSGRNSLAVNTKAAGFVSGYAIDLGFSALGASVNVAAGGSTSQVDTTSNNTAMGLEISYPYSDVLTLSAGTSQGTISNAERDNMFVTAAYTMDADTTLSLGYSTKDSETTAGVVDEERMTTVNVSRSLGGGVSIFAEYASADYEDDQVGSSGSSIALGTVVSF